MTEKFGFSPVVGGALIQFRSLHFSKIYAVEVPVRGMVVPIREPGDGIGRAPPLIAACSWTPPESVRQLGAFAAGLADERQEGPYKPSRGTKSFRRGGFVK